MGVRFPSVQSTTIQNATMVTTAETVLATTPPLNLPLDFAAVFLFAYFLVTIGTAGTQIQYRFRRGTTTGGTQLQVALPLSIVTAGVAFTGTLVYFDTPGAVAGQQWSVTANVISATGNTTVNDVAIIAFVL